jgi:uncharacterized iron-regulated membrane protein
MSTFRKILFWTHLICGLVAGVVIFIMSFTGAAIALQPQILLWAERDIRTVSPPPGRRWLGPERLLANVREQRPDLTITGLTLEHDPTLAVAVTLTGAATPGAGGNGARPPAGPGGGRGQPPQTTVYVNPYTGDVLGQLDPTTPARRFFRINTDWHRWLAMSGNHRNTGRWITGVSNAAFLVLAVTGLYIWIPRVWSGTAFKAVMLFRSGLYGKARDFNWHNVIGVWSATVLVVLTFTAMCISFPKTYDVIYTVTGIERPLATSASGAAGAAGADLGSAPSGVSLAGLDRAWSVAEAQMPSWRSIAMRLPPSAGQAVTFTFNDRERINPMARSTLTVDVAEARIVRWEPYEGLTVGQRLRTWMRFGHTGELWGLPGQIIAGLASAGGCVLVYTGVALALRRFVAWRARRARRPVVTGVSEQPAA